MNPRQTDYRLRYGTFTSSGITSAYSIPSFAVQSDQIQDNQTEVPWTAPKQNIPPEYVRIVVNADRSANADGNLHGVLGPFSMWTFGMIAYVLTNIFPSNAYSSPVSMMLYDPTDTAVFLNATMYRPVIGQDYEPVFAGWQNVKLRYEYATITS